MNLKTILTFSIGAAIFVVRSWGDEERLSTARSDGDLPAWPQSDPLMSPSLLSLGHAKCGSAWTQKRGGHALSPRPTYLFKILLSNLCIQ